MAIINQHPAIAATQPGAQQKTLHEFAINDSSFLSAVKYDSSTMQCTVVLKKGGEYTYFMIFPMIIDQWMQSASKGTFYAKQIRGKFKVSRLINKTVGPRGGNNGKPSRRTNAGSHSAHAGRHRKKGY